MEAMMELIVVSTVFIVFCILALIIYLAVKRWKTVSLIYVLFVSIIIGHFLLIYWAIYFSPFIHMPTFLFRYAAWLLILIK
jgi:hypothetical protein